MNKGTLSPPLDRDLVTGSDKSLGKVLGQAINMRHSPTAKFAGGGAGVGAVVGAVILGPLGAAIGGAIGGGLGGYLGAKREERTRREREG